MTPPALEIEGVTKDYRGLRPLRIQQLTVAAGEPVAILGFDAASAETFVNLLTGATLPDAGSIRVFGRSTSSIADGDDWLASLDTFGIVTPRAVLLEELTPIQNLAMPITLDVEPPAPDVREQVEALAREVGLPGDMWTGAVANLNGAARARVRLGRALAMNPALLLLEHASAGMAPGEAAAFGRDVRALAAPRARAAARVVQIECDASKGDLRMVFTKPRVLLVVGIVAGFSVLAGAQTKKAATKTAAKKRVRVFFVEPKNGATVTSPVHMKFGAEGIQIAAVPPGDVTTARPGMAHYHVGIDQDCLPPGKTIVKGTPQWVHFGDGKDVFDSQLTPGKHKLALQLGDDLHNTLPGTCSAITVNVK